MQFLSCNIEEIASAESIAAPRLFPSGEFHDSFAISGIDRACWRKSTYTATREGEIQRVRTHKGASSNERRIMEPGMARARSRAPTLDDERRRSRSLEHPLYTLHDMRARARARVTMATRVAYCATTHASRPLTNYCSFARSLAETSYADARRTGAEGGGEAPRSGGNLAEISKVRGSVFVHRAGRIPRGFRVSHRNAKQRSHRRDQCASRNASGIAI